MVTRQTGIEIISRYYIYHHCPPDTFLLQALTKTITPHSIQQGFAETTRLSAGAVGPGLHHFQRLESGWVLG